MSITKTLINTGESGEIMDLLRAEFKKEQDKLNAMDYHTTPPEVLLKQSQIVDEAYNKLLKNNFKEEDYEYYSQREH